MGKLTTGFSRKDRFFDVDLFALLLAALVIVLMLHSVALPASWEPIGPSGGNFICSATHPTDANEITVITTSPSPSDAYRSSDGGASWSKVGEIPTSYLNDASAFDSSRLFAVTGYGCYRTTDGGASWSYASFPYLSGYANCVCVDPTDASKVYAAGYKYNSPTGDYSLAFFKSLDGGQTWSASSFFGFGFFFPYGMAVSRSNPSIIYVSGYKYVGSYYYGALLKSWDAGASWTDISSAVDPALYGIFYSVAIDPTDADRVYVGSSYFYWSTDGGASWTKGSTLLYAYAIGIDPVDTYNVYVGGYDDVFVSSNYGQSWTVHSDCIKGMGANVEVAPASPSEIYVSAYCGLYKSVDSGSTWSAAHDGIYATRAPALAVAPSEPNTVLVEFEGCGVMGSYDSGDNWNHLGYFVACGNICDILVNPSNRDIVLALEGDG